jgi:hypothetical protein
MFCTEIPAAGITEIGKPPVYFLLASTFMAFTVDSISTIHRDVVTKTTYLIT